MMTVKEKYEAKLKRDREYWLNHARQFFRRDAPIHQAPADKLIFWLYADAETWTAFFEDRVDYRLGEAPALLSYAALDEIFGLHLRATKDKTLIDETVVAKRHEIWVANRQAYFDVARFVLAMTRALGVEERRMRQTG